VPPPPAQQPRGLLRREQAPEKVPLSLPLRAAGAQQRVGRVIGVDAFGRDRPHQPFPNPTGALTIPALSRFDVIAWTKLRSIVILSTLKLRRWCRLEQPVPKFWSEMRTPADLKDTIP
jgi:hypothetical protein